MSVTASEQRPRPGGPETLEWTMLEDLLAHTADVVLLIDASSGSTLRRWYDAGHSRLPLVDAPVERVINRVHPDDIAAVLDVMARTAHEGGTRSTRVRIHPEMQAELGDALAVSVHDVGHVLEHALLVQGWLVASDPASPSDAPWSTMSSLAAAAPVGLQVRSGNGTVSFENERFTDLAGAARPRLDALVDEALAGPGERIVDVDAGERSLRLRVVPTFDPAGRFLLAVASLEDVTSLRRAEASRDEAEGMFRAVFDGSPVATAIVELDGRLTRVNESFSVICGFSADELVGRHFASITHPDDLAVDQALLDEVVAGVRSSYQLEKRYLHAAGHHVWVELTVAGVRTAGGELRYFVAHVDDITGRKASLGDDQSANDLAHWATHDHLTGLANRRYLAAHLASSAPRARRTEDRLAVVFVDLDDFKPVNDRHGHQVGDDVLRTVARRMRNTCRGDELVARYGGDEFVVVTRGPRTPHDLSALVERILSAVRTPIDGLVDSAIRVGASAGVAMGRVDEPADSILRRADEASYRAKRDGKDRACFATA